MSDTSREKTLQTGDVASSSAGEITVLAIALGIVIAVVMTAANVYLGLYAGMTVSASIPAAVIAMGVFRMLRRNNIFASNIVQTMASAGESLAAGVIFTVPAIVLVGAWTEFRFWPTTLIAICGGLLGVMFMIPLRRALVVEDDDLTYPEGVACAAVLREGSSGGRGLRDIVSGLGIGSVVKLAGTGFGLLAGSVEYAAKIGGRAFFVGSDISPALFAVGYIVRLEIAILIFLGGAIGWLIGIPLLGSPGELTTSNALDTAWTLWTTRIRYLGVGAMIVGGIWSIFAVRTGIASGLRGLRGSYAVGNDSVAPTERNMSLVAIAVILVATTIAMFGLYEYLLRSFGISLLATLVMFVASFFITAVASYICGLVGSSNSPVSGMTISALLGTAVFLLVLGFRGDSAILATLGVAAVVCCAACTSGDCSQDLKTGYLIGATPKYQQYAQVIGILVPAFVIAPVLTLLHSSYGIGTGLKAPQATLFASIAEGIFGAGDLPYDMVWIGVALGGFIIAGDLLLKRAGSTFRLHVMPLAVGIYLPITLAVPILLGGVARTLVERKRANVAASSGVQPDDTTDRGVLLSSGLIAGEAIMGVVLAVVIYLQYDWTVGMPSIAAEVIGITALVALAAYVVRIGRSRSS